MADDRRCPQCNSPFHYIDLAEIEESVGQSRTLNAKSARKKLAKELLGCGGEVVRDGRSIGGG